MPRPGACVRYVFLEQSSKANRYSCAASTAIGALLFAASVADIQKALAAGALTYERGVQLYLNRIEAYDKNGPRLNAVIQINPRALDMARSLDPSECEGPFV